VIVQGIKEVLGVLFVLVFNSEVIDYKGKLDGLPGVLP
jgi:hypothetical protein